MSRSVGSARTGSSAPPLIDRVAARLGRKLFEVPVGFKWFAAGLHGGGLGLCGEERAGASFLRRNESVEALASAGQKALLAALWAQPISATEVGEEIESVLSRAPGNGAPISGIKVSAASGWLAARPSVLEEAQAIVDAAISTASGSGRR